MSVAKICQYVKCSATEAPEGVSHTGARPQDTIGDSTQIRGHILPNSELTGQTLIINKNAVADWAVFAGNPLTEPSITEALPLNMIGK